MKNNKGFGRTEILTMVTLLIVAFAFFGYLLLKGANKQKFDTMKENALSFSKAASTNIASFSNVDVVYLDELVSAGVSGNIKNPFGGGNCDGSQSRVNFTSGRSYATLRCGEYLIDYSDFSDKEAVPVYKVTEWDEEKITGTYVEKRTLFNCLDNGREVFDKYYEEFYFVFKYNEKYGTNAYFANDAKNCEVTSKEFYRTKTRVKLK